MTGAATASSQAAADAGAAVLGRGGNAADAAVAAALASCVADPCNVGIGGYGGYAMVKRPDGRAACVRFPLWAPSGISTEDLARPYPDAGPACSAVPNVVGGLDCLLRGFGTISWAEASAPAIALARDGVVTNATTRRAFELHRSDAFFADCFECDDLGAGDLRFRQPALAGTLERMAEAGPAWFYEGPIGVAAVAAWRAAGVAVSLEDWRDQAGSVAVVAPAEARIGDVLVQAAPLGFSGSACLLAMLEAAARIARRRRLSEPEALAELAVAMAAVWQHRFDMPSGNDFAGVDIAAWIEGALDGPGQARAPAPAPEHTAHLNVADGEGMLVAATLTHGPAWFGGRWVVPGTGVLMNGGMHNFTRPALVVRDGRRFGISNMTPTIAETSGGDRIAIGCPGARRIPSNIALALARILFEGPPLQAAVSAGRVHAESGARAHFEEDRLGARVRAALERRFPTVDREHPDVYFGPLTAIRRTAAGAVENATDDRTPGFAAIAA